MLGGQYELRTNKKQRNVIEKRPSGKNRPEPLEHPL